jgi:hypothetical protein
MPFAHLPLQSALQGSTHLLHQHKAQAEKVLTVPPNLATALFNATGGLHFRTASQTAERKEKCAPTSMPSLIPVLIWHPKRCSIVSGQLAGLLENKKSLIAQNVDKVRPPALGRFSTVVAQLRSTAEALKRVADESHGQVVVVHIGFPVFQPGLTRL